MCFGWFVNGFRQPVPESTRGARNMGCTALKMRAMRCAKDARAVPRSQPRSQSHRLGQGCRHFLHNNEELDGLDPLSMFGLKLVPPAAPIQQPGNRAFDSALAVPWPAPFPSDSLAAVQAASSVILV